MKNDKLIIEKQKEYIAYLKRAIHSESIIDNITAGVRDKYDKELAFLEAEQRKVESKVSAEEMLDKTFEETGLDLSWSQKPLVLNVIRRFAEKYHRDRIREELVKFALIINCSLPTKYLILYSDIDE